MADPAARPPRLLVVEDHLDTARAFARVLTAQGFEVLVAGSVAEAVALCKSQDFDLMVLDIGLPDGTGIELLARVRETCRTPAIAVSGYGTSDDIARAKDAGFVDHLVKPVTVETLGDAVRRALTATAK